MIKQKFEIERIANSGYVLFIDDEQSACPFLPPMMMQSNMGGTKLVRVPCSTLCPMAKIEEGSKANDEGTREPCLKYVVACGNKNIEHIVTEKQSLDQNNKPGLLKSL